MTESFVASPHADSPFNRLVREFAQKAGFPANEIEQSDGVEFESDGFTARLIAHPTDSALMVVEVDVAEADPDEIIQRENAWLLHQINHAARFEHGWIAHIDETNVLMISLFQAIPGSTPELIEQLLADGIDRAQALASLWLTDRQSEPASTPDPAPPGLIRG